ncbi:MAG: hypothetical protein IT322_19780 [Anaerolineae bacterium]|nr:hypothetical protein [Anaerolineae bacterium]
MKRLLVLVLILGIALAAFATPRVNAQEAPSGVFPGTWPYTLPPNHHLSSFGAGGLNENLGVLYRQIVQMPLGFYKWAENKYEGLLAEKFGFTADNKAYEVTLKDAKWSNGEAITTDDVLVTFSIGRIRALAVFNTVSEVKKVDDKTVQFIFKDQPSLLAERQILKEYIVDRFTYADLAAEADKLVAAGKTSADQEWKDLATKINEFRPTELIASGPYNYTLADVSDKYMTLKWQPNSIYSGMVKFGEIRLWAGETDATTPLVLSGEIAHSTNVYPPATQQAFKDAGIRLIIQPRMYGPALLMKADVYPFNIKEVRQAMAYAINREQNAFLTNGFGGTATVYMCGLLDSSVPTLLNEDTIAKLNRYEYSLEKAAELMEKAGFKKNDAGKWADKDGKLVTAEYKIPAEFADFSGASQDAIQQLNDFGFDITALAIPWQQTADDIRKGDFQLSVWSWASGSPFATTQFFGPIQRFNYVSFTDGRVGMNFQMEFEYNGKAINLNDMINQASAGIDVAAQKERAGEIAVIINDLMPYIPLNVILSTEPWNENILAGAPADGDPILQNPSSDHFVIWYMLNGLISPAAK